ncbi:MAG: (2Fe-2S)-binding protein [Candidatus Binatia bacterium]
MSAKLTPEEIRARLRVVCICKGIKLGKIADAIKAGATTVEQVNRATGSGSGTCGNESGVTRCRPVIEELLRTGGRPPSAMPASAAAETGVEFWFPTPVRKPSVD